MRAAYLAACGVDACPTLLTETDGYLPAFYGDVHKADRLMSTLGKSFCLEEPGLLIKKYPACFSVYQCVDAALEIYKFHDFSPEIGRAHV